MIKNNDKSKPYSHPRWNDKQLPVITGYKELTKEEKERVDRDFKEYCENYEVENVLLRTRVVKRNVGHGTPTIIFHFKCFQTRKI